MIGNKKVLAVTLARGGSKKIPNKNIIDVLGRPLIEYTFDAVSGSEFIDDYVVSTDSEDIASVCKKNNVRVINRPAVLSMDATTSADSLLHCIGELKEDYDYLIEVMATNPLKNSSDIDGVIYKLFSTNSDSVVSVVRIYDHHPSRVKYIHDDIMRDFYPEILESRRQDLNPAAYVRNGSIYGMKYGFFIENKVRYNKESRPYIMPECRTVNIDEPIDLELAKIMLSQGM